MIEVFIGILSVSTLTLSVMLYLSKRKSNTLQKDLLARLANQSKVISELEFALKKQNRPRLGLVAKWLTPNEEESSYILNIYNDHPDRIFNIAFQIPEEYKDCCRANLPKSILDADSELQIHILPDRQAFTAKWMKRKLETITFTIQYTDTPVSKNPRSIQVPFKVANTSEHFRSRLKIVAKGKID